MRDMAIGIIRAVGVDTGGCNIQFAVDPRDGRMIVIEMNPRVSRSSALASKATGFPIAKIAAKVAIGYTLDEIPNDITRETPASFEPTLDYVVVKVPRFAFEKFPAADPVLTTHMKSVGEAMAIGRNFTEALQKALRSLEKPRRGLQLARRARRQGRAARSARRCRTTAGCSVVMDAIRAGATRRRGLRRDRASTRGSSTSSLLINEVAREVAAADDADARAAAPGQAARLLRRADRRAHRQLTEDVVRGVRHALGVRPVYKTVDTCAAEFAAHDAVPLLVLRRGDRGRSRAPSRR